MNINNTNRGLNFNANVNNRGTDTGVPTEEDRGTNNTPNPENTAKNLTNPNIKNNRKQNIELAKVWINVNQEMKALGEFDETYQAKSLGNILQVLEREVHIKSVLQLVIASPNLDWISNTTLISNTKINTEFLRFFKLLNSLYSKTQNTFRNQAQLIFYSANDNKTVSIEQLLMKYSRILPNITIIGFHPTLFPKTKTVNFNHREIQVQEINAIINGNLAYWSLNGRVTKQAIIL